MQNIGLPWHPFWIYNPHRKRKLCTEPHKDQSTCICFQMVLTYCTYMEMLLIRSPI